MYLDRPTNFFFSFRVIQNKAFSTTNKTYLTFPLTTKDTFFFTMLEMIPCLSLYFERVICLIATAAICAFKSKLPVKD